MQITISIAGVLFLSFNNEIGPSLIDFNRFAKYFQFFTLGVLSMKYRFIYEKLVRSELLKTVSMISFFLILAILNYGCLPSLLFHVSRDVVLRYLGTFIIISCFVSYESQFYIQSRFNSGILDIGRKSLAIYLIQYFFIPDFKPILPKVSLLDDFSLHVLAFIYTAFVILACYIIITLLSNSKFLNKYLLGQK